MIPGYLEAHANSLDEIRDGAGDDVRAARIALEAALAAAVAPPMASAIELRNLRRLIADDAFAITFQSLGRYRSALLTSQAAESRSAELEDARVSSSEIAKNPAHLTDVQTPAKPTAFLVQVGVTRCQLVYDAKEVDAYIAAAPVVPPVRYATDEEVRESAKRVMDKHRSSLEKLSDAAVVPPVDTLEWEIVEACKRAFQLGRESTEDLT